MTRLHNLKYFAGSICIIFLFIISFNNVYAQDSTYNDLNKPAFKDRLYFGGYLGLQFGTITLIDVSPLVGIMITERFSTGLGLTYQYYKHNYSGYKYSTNIFGGRVNARYYIFKNFFGQAEYELLNFDAYIDPFNTERVNVHSYLIGAGYRQWISYKAFASFVILWNLNETNLSPYTNPVIRIGFGVGL